MMTSHHAGPGPDPATFSERIAFSVRGDPAPQGSKKGWVVKGRVVMSESSKKLKPWRALVADCLSAAMVAGNLQAIEGPVSVALTFRRRKPKSYPKLKPTWPITAPDVDKLARAVLDALSGIAIRDDAQVVRLLAEKMWGEPGVDVLVESWRRP